jgi:hypothetical protein
VPPWWIREAPLLQGFSGEQGSHAQQLRCPSLCSPCESERRETPQCYSMAAAELGLLCRRPELELLHRLGPLLARTDRDRSPTGTVGPPRRDTGAPEREPPPARDGEGEDRHHRQWSPGLPASICAAPAEEGAVAGPVVHRCPCRRRRPRWRRTEAAGSSPSGAHLSPARGRPCSKPSPHHGSLRAPVRGSRRHGRPVPRATPSWPLPDSPTPPRVREREMLRRPPRKVDGAEVARWEGKQRRAKRRGGR